MHKGFIKLAAFLGALGVVLGAFGAHGLKQRIDIADVTTLSSFQTGVQYQMYHALALLGTSVLFEKFGSSILKWAGNCFITGIILFSGSLYLITVFKIMHRPLPGFIGPITPFGGLFFIAGWIFLFVAVTQGSKSAK